MSAIDDIAAERKRQVEKECWSLEHDDAHSFGEMARAAACYAIPQSMLDYRVQNPGAGSVFNLIWPPQWGHEWWKPKDRRRNLVRAAALLVAEIERLDRKSPSKADAA